MDINRSGFKRDLWNVFLQILITVGVFHATSASDCDVEFVYSEYFNSNGFKVVCKDIRKGQENIIRYISAHNAFLLFIKNATLANVTSDLFENVPKLRELSIEDSEILIDGKVDLFSKLESLQNLNLKNTKLKEIGNGTFSSLFQMRFLHLENISISVISRNSLSSDSLETFEFINNGLKDIEDIPLCGLPNIRVIVFKKNRIKRLRPDLYQCISPKANGNTRNTLLEDNHLGIETIDLSHNEISSLDGALKSFTKLIHLNLENNVIERISDTDFEMTTDLDYLNLANNSISVISKAAFSKLNHLRQINLSNNKIVNIELKFLPLLSEINLSYNKLRFENIQGIHHLPSLETLDLSYNILNGTSYFFNNFSSMVSLNLNGNNLILENDMFLNLLRLENLYLSNNGILHIPNLVFNNMTFLRELDLSKNKLEILEDANVFSNLSSLQMLNLSYNNLESLNYVLFTKLDNVEVLDIAGNKLKDLDYPLIITNMRALETINIKDNLFSCNFLHKVVRYFAWKGVNYKADNITYYEEENIGGIHCQEEAAARIDKSVSSNPETTSVFVIILSSAIFAVLVLLLILILKYYQFYRRSKYHAEQFELIED